uniref:Uncharacterized protein n=1 Tax=Anguilla anguilla TaxID=7936 RepID=A0A0E9R6J6_ANGAN
MRKGIQKTGQFLWMCSCHLRTLTKGYHFSYRHKGRKIDYYELHSAVTVSVFVV